MKVTISTIDEFDRRARRLAKKYKSLKDDLRTFQQEIMQNPLMGIDLGRGVRKIRMAITSKGKGKSGGARVLTLTVLVSEDADVTCLLSTTRRKSTTSRTATSSGSSARRGSKPPFLPSSVDINSTSSPAAHWTPAGDDAVCGDGATPRRPNRRICGRGATGRRSEAPCRCWQFLALSDARVPSRVSWCH